MAGNRHRMPGNGEAVELTNSLYQLSALHWIVVIFALFCSALLISHEGRSCEDCQSYFDYQSKFTNVSSNLNLKQIKSDLDFASSQIGQHYAGSFANEVLLRNYLLTRLNDVVTLAKNNGINAEVDEQISNEGSFNLGPMIKTYNKIRNLVLRFTGKNSSSQSRPALLINCHYDSALGSVGASDDFVSCAVMLELARHVAIRSFEVNYDLILLFNGAEETILPASHAFITQHRWAPDIKLFINLEAAGSGGRLFMFQSGPGSATKFILDAYAKTFVNPNTNIFSQMIFQNGLIPSDTDFRIFRDYGLLPGLDMAYIHEGYSYHTIYDTPDRILDSCISLSAFDIMSLTKFILNDERFTEIRYLEPHPDKASFSTVEQFAAKILSNKTQNDVFFDVYGLFTFVIPFNYDLTIFCIIAVLCVLDLLSKYSVYPVSGLFLGIALQLTWFVSAVAFLLCLAFTYTNLGINMAWYTNKYNIFSMYVLPSMVFSVYFHSILTSLTDHKSIFLRSYRLNSFLSHLEWCSREGRFTIRDIMSANRVILLVVSIIFVWFKIPKYLISCALIIPLLIEYVSNMLKLYGQNPIKTFLTIFLSSALLLGLLTLLLEFFIPIFGRSGNLCRPEYIIAALISLSLLLPGLYITPFLKVTSPYTASKFCSFSLQIYVALIVFILLSPYGFPYGKIKLSNVNEDHPPSYRYQRTSIQHVNRVIRDETDSIVLNETGILIYTMDSNGLSYLQPDYVNNIQILQKFKSYFHKSKTFEVLRNTDFYVCDDKLPYCGMPHINSYEKRIKEMVFVKLPISNMINNIPVPDLEMASKEKSSTDENSETYKISFLVHNYAQLSVLNFRFDDRRYKLENVSFDLGGGTPTPLPTSTAASHPHSQHFLVNHINQAGAEPGKVNKDAWKFWIIVKKNTTIVEEKDVPEYIDFAVSSHVVDQVLPFGSTASLQLVLAELPEWAVPSTWTSSYNHRKFKI